MVDFTRLTVVGSTARSEVVVPSEEVLAAVLPQLLDLLREAPAAVTRPLRLVRPTGEQLALDRSAADQRLLDGEVVRLVRAEDAPPPPEVADVTDVVGDELGRRGDLWSARSRTLTAGLALAALGLFGPGLARLSDAETELALLGTIVAAALVGRLGRRVARLGAGPALLLTALSLGIGLDLAGRLAWAPGLTPIGGVLPIATAAALLGWLCAGVGLGVGLGRRSVLVGSLLGLALAGVPLACSTLGPERAAALGLLAAVVACGVLPRYAVWAAGLTAMHTSTGVGRLWPRNQVEGAVEGAYASLSWSVYAVAAAVGSTAGVLLSSRHDGAVGLGVTTLVVTALRTRGFPLAGQQLALWGGLAAGVLVGMLGQPRLTPTLLAYALVGLGVLIGALSLVRPPDPTRALLRRVGDLVELVGVVALVPLTLGMFGVYADLLRTFG